MLIRFFILLVAFLFTGTSSIFSKIHYTGKEKIFLVSTIEGKNCFVSYVTINGYTYLLKQKKDGKKQLAVVRDALAAYIAKALKIAHQVDIVASKKEFSGKIKRWWPATLHTIVPGETVRKQKDIRYNALRLRQLWAQAQTYGEKGLTRAIITYMTWHKQLPVIVALDLFIGNSDRHCGNLFYDPVTDKFWAIDMDDTFNKDLCLLAYKKLKLMMQDDEFVFTQEEIAALICMKKTLQFLVDYHNPKDIIEKLYVFAKQAGFSKGMDLYDEKVGKKLSFYEKMIIQTHESARQLIVLLDKIIKNK
jgi:hypothetical protein